MLWDYLFTFLLILNGHTLFGTFLWQEVGAYMHQYTCEKETFQVGDLVSHSKIGTPGMILEIFTFEGDTYAVVNYGNEARTERISDLLPTFDKIERLYL